MADQLVGTIATDPCKMVYYICPACSRLVLDHVGPCKKNCDKKYRIISEEDLLNIQAMHYHEPAGKKYRDSKWSTAGQDGDIQARREIEGDS